jgi:hypothetical protein
VRRVERVSEELERVSVISRIMIARNNHKNQLTRNKLNDVQHRSIVLPLKVISQITRKDQHPHIRVLRQLFADTGYNIVIPLIFSNLSKDSPISNDQDVHPPLTHGQSKNTLKERDHLIPIDLRINILLNLQPTQLYLIFHRCVTLQSFQFLSIADYALMQICLLHISLLRCVRVDIRMMVLHCLRGKEVLRTSETSMSDQDKYFTFDVPV